MSFNPATLKEICGRFALRGPVTEVAPLGEGFINDTFVVMLAGNAGPAYILQRKNHAIFRDVPAMMNNIRLVTEHLKRKIAMQGGDPNRESLTITPCIDGALCYRDQAGNYWAMCDFIPDTVAYQTADTPRLTRQGGYGIGRFQSMLSDFTEPLADILPGFHDMRFRFGQWDEALRRDAAGRCRNLGKQIDWIESRREKMMTLWIMYEQGVIPRRVAHNDTKISNILFDRQGEVLCVIDLDTVSASMCLNDFGDAIRSYTNTGLEDDPDLSRVRMDMDKFRAYTEGYIEGTGGFLTQVELDNLAASALYITYEQVLRFLMDYIDGDVYYKTKGPDHNLVRATAQHRLLCSMEEQYEHMCKVVKAAAGR